MANKKSIWILFFTLMLIISGMSLVNAAFTATWDSPLTTQTINGTFNFTVTTASANAVANITFYYKNGTDPKFTICNSLVANQTTYGCSNDTTTLLTDGSSYTLGVNVTGYPTNNATQSANGNYTFAEITVTVDNTAPTSSFTVDIDQVEFLSAVPIQVDCSGSTDATDTALSRIVRLYKDGEQTSTKTSPSVGNGTFTFDTSDFDFIGTGLINCRVTDNANQEDWGTNYSILVKGKDGEVKKAQALSEISVTTPGRGLNGKTIAVIIVVLAGGLFFANIAGKRSK